MACQLIVSISLYKFQPPPHPAVGGRGQAPTPAAGSVGGSCGEVGDFAPTPAAGFVGGRY